MNRVYLRSDKGEYLPQETICGAVYLDIRTPSVARGVQLSFKGTESVCCDCDIEGNRVSLQASNDYVDFCNAELFVQKGPFALGSYCFPFRLQLPYNSPGTFHASGSDPGKAWSAHVTYRLKTNILGAETMEAEQDVVVLAATPEALRDNNLTQAHELRIPSNSFFGFGRKVHLTLKPLSNFVRSGDCARLRMVVTNSLKSRSCSFSIKLVRRLTLTLPYKPRPSLDASGDPGEEIPVLQDVQQHAVQVEGGSVVIREMSGDLSEHARGSLLLASGGGLDNIMIPLKTSDGHSVMPSVCGKYIQCEYSLEVSLQMDDKIQTISCPIMGILPEENAQWLSWKPLPWMNRAHVKLSKPAGPITPPEQLLGSEAFGRIPRFQDL
ncbi:uncharacterized protein [Littorina saxatilis]|uniref:Arrestin-like N-terminal domain-containing protein n=1 Tax=Littorina saxatilis TaxID=31220 RepID=A0AAN9GLF9_9CAEN